ncbi:MAG TPA: polyisoprenoid-binding protein [Bacteroides sp.]|nr:polyisoprenoid-binding protein [Bacteroides sp.]
MKKTALLFVTILGLSQAILAQTNWVLDKAHTDIRFTATHMVISEVDGEFKQFDGKVVSRSDDFHGADVEFTAKVASIDTDNERRDGHLKSDDFFNAEKYPELKFSGKIEKQGNDYYLAGNLTIRDVTKSVRFDVKYNGTLDLQNGKKAGFKISGTVDRFEYGLKWDRTVETGGLVAGREIQITCNVELDESKGS